jgi:N6-adenosine-specific RNA methylase IME4
LVLDCPWEYEQPVAGRARPNYATMTQEELLALPVREWAEDKCHLFVWATNVTMPQACELVKAFGFEHKTILTWVKNAWALAPILEAKPSM